MYSYQILSDPSNHHTGSIAIVPEEDEESKSVSNSSEPSSLLTEEETSGNHLSPEARAMLNLNQKMRKSLINELMNLKSLSRSLIDSDISLDKFPNDEKILIKSSSGIQSEELKNSEIEAKESLEKFDIKKMLEKTAKLYIELQSTRKKVDENKKEIYEKEREFSELEDDLKRVGTNLKSAIRGKGISNECVCTLQ